jgi:hypothetical protein
MILVKIELIILARKISCLKQIHDILWHLLQQATVVGFGMLIIYILIFI